MQYILKDRLVNLLRIYRDTINSLPIRLTLMAVSITIFISILSNLHFYFSISDVLSSAFNNGMSDMAHDLGVAASTLLEHDELPALEQMLASSGSSDVIQNILVIDPAGSVITQKNEKSAGLAPLLAHFEDGDHPPYNQITPFENDPAVFFYAVPLYASEDAQPARYLGTVAVIFSQAPIAADRRREMNELGYFFMALVMLAILLAAPAIYLMVVRPLKVVTTATQSIAEGAYSTRLRVKGPHEIRLLAQSFNKMAAELEANEQKTMEHLRQMGILHEISILTSSNVNLAEMLSRLAYRLARLINSSGALILLWDPARHTPLPGAVYTTDDLIGKQIKFSPEKPTLTASVLECSRPIAVYDIHNTPYICPENAAILPYKSMLGLPLIVNNRPIGVALIGEAHQKRIFSDDEIHLAMAAAGQIATAISTSQLFADLASERNRLEVILNAVSDAIIVMDLSGVVLSSNRALTAVTGVAPIDAVFQTPWDLLAIPEEQVSHLQAEVVHAVLRGNTWRKELVGRKADGSVYDADLIIAPIHDHDNRLIGSVASIRDISELKEFDRMKNRFVSTVSHELRTPLSIIGLHTENLLEFYDRLSDSQRREIVKDISVETSSLHQLIEDLLSLSRLDSGRSEPRFAHYNLCETLVPLISNAQALAKEKQIDFVFQLTADSLPVLADRDPLGQVFRNLFSNAIKFTPTGGHIRVCASREARQAVVRISDTGIGIPADDIPRLFERFFRSELSVHNQIPGTGLGLSISQEIIQRHRGLIAVESQVGQGSTFTVTIPLANIDPDALAVKAPAISNQAV